MNYSNDFKDLLLPYFSGCKNRIKQKTSPAASKMKLFMTLIDGLFGEQLNNITKNPISDAAGALNLPLYLVFLKNVCVLFVFSEHSVHLFMAG